MEFWGHAAWLAKLPSDKLSVYLGWFFMVITNWNMVTERKVDACSVSFFLQFFFRDAERDEAGSVALPISDWECLTFQPAQLIWDKTRLLRPIWGGGGAHKVRECLPRKVVFFGSPSRNTLRCHWLFYTAIHCLNVSTIGAGYFLTFSNVIRWHLPAFDSSLPRNDISF